MNEIRFSQDFGREFQKLEERASKGNAEYTYLLKITERGIAKLLANLEAGKKIPKKLWPKEYVKKYGLNNLWKINLDSFWRMLYTVVGSETKIIGVVLDVLDHKKYSRKFKYKK